MGPLFISHLSEISLVKSSLRLIFYLIVLVTSSCNKIDILEQNPGIKFETFAVSKYGSEKCFDLATWNIEHFPKNKNYTITYLYRIIKRIDIDLIAFQEIDRNQSFVQLLDSLDHYRGYISPLPEYGQRMAILYKSDFISISDPVQLFTDDIWAFPRPPLVTFVTVRKDNIIVFDFILIVVHLKAFMDEESESRRRKACEKLKYYIDTYLLTGSEKDIIILGDFNDDLNDSLQDNIFSVFLNDSLHYRILTLPLIEEATYIGDFGSSVDHLIITENVIEEYNSGFTSVLKIDEEFLNYFSLISDHRPVLSRFFVF
jgi:hypothetical protein